MMRRYLMHWLLIMIGLVQCFPTESSSSNGNNLAKRMSPFLYIWDKGLIYWDSESKGIGEDQKASERSSQPTPPESEQSTPYQNTKQPTTSGKQREKSGSGARKALSPDAKAGVARINKLPRPPFRSEVEKLRTRSDGWDERRLAWAQCMDECIQEASADVTPIRVYWEKAS